MNNTPQPAQTGRASLARRLLVLLAVLLAVAGLATAQDATWADLSLAPVFQSGMVLQRDTACPVWGSAEPGKTVQVSLAGQTKTASVAADGSWKLAFDPLPASAKAPAAASAGGAKTGPAYVGQKLVANYVYPKDYTNRYDDLVLEDILVGDLWLCMGQSNMEFGISSVATSDEELADSAYPGIRTLLMPKLTAPFPVTRVNGTWMEANEDNLTTGGWGGFSGVGFIFGRRIHRETGVPVGLVQAAYGGAPIQAFINREAFAANKNLGRDSKAIAKVDSEWEAAKAGFPKARHAWDGITDYSKLKPTICYNAMVAPLVPLKLKGLLWYQGESNVGNGKLYTTYMKALIEGLRTAFAQPDLPFYFVQIAPFKYGGSLSGMWESQFDALQVPATGMALTVDVGNYDDIHPTRKREVGERLALQALAGAYGKAGIDPDGPVALSARREGSTVVVKFSHAQGGLKTTDGQAPLSFWLAGSSNKSADFQAAQAVIKGDTVILSVPGLDQPGFVRYAWEDNPATNLVDQDNLPTRPFSLKVEG